MNTERMPKDSNLLNKKIKDIWNKNVFFWDKHMGEGDDFYKSLIEPSQEYLLELKKGEAVLDIAYGNEQFVRRMTQLKTKVREH